MIKRITYKEILECSDACNAVDRSRIDWSVMRAVHRCLVTACEQLELFQLLDTPSLREPGANWSQSNSQFRPTPYHMETLKRFDMVSARYRDILKALDGRELIIPEYRVILDQEHVYCTCTATDLEFIFQASASPDEYIPQYIPARRMWGPLLKLGELLAIGLFAPRVEVPPQTCKTPDAVYQTHINDDHLLLNMQYGRTLDLNEAQSIEIEEQLHDALEGIMAQYYTEEVQSEDVPVITEVTFNGRGDVTVLAILSDGTEEELFRYFYDELSFSEEDLIGLTPWDARELRTKRDIAYLQS